MKKRYTKKSLNEKTVYKVGCLLSLMMTTLIGASVHYASAQIDINEYPPGHPNVTVTAVDQLKTFPVPRYKQGHTLLRNFNWMEPSYFGSRFQPGVTDAQAIANSVEVQTELAKNFNYYVNLSWGSDNFNTAWKNLANANPQWPLGLITFRAHTGSKLFNQSLPSANYLQNSSGQYLDPNGNITTNKVWRPTAPASLYTADGLQARSWITSALTGLNRNIDWVNEDGEVFWLYKNNVMALDPVVTAAKNASGLSWEDYLATQVRDNDIQAYRDQFMSLSWLQNAKYTQYKMDGQRDWNFRWEQQRYISSQLNGQYYSTSDFYVRWPSNWKDWQGPWHGLKWMTESRHYEIAAGDRLYSPCVAAGWDVNPENDVRPAQWLGLIKLVGIYGAEFYYTGYFTETMPPNDPKGYAWQAVMPSYSQAIISRYEDILKGGSLMAGDMTNVSANPDIPYYQFSTGATNKVVSVRKKDNANKYAITGTIQNNSNVINSTPLVADASITVNGQNLQFKIRRQGSTYIYDNTVTSAPVFYQLDEWHEASHPYRWSKDFSLEAELYDNINKNFKIKTSVPAGTASGDFRNFTSFITFDDTTTVFIPIEYVFQPRSVSASTFYVWVKARSRVNGTTTGLSITVDNANVKTIGCISDTNWTWYRLDACNQQAIVYSNLSLTNHTLRLTPSNSKLEIDKVILTVDAGMFLLPAGSACSSTPVTVTPSGPLTFCQGGNVTLTASSGTSYQWSNGATSQAITISTSGTYTVTVNGSGCTGVSAPQVVNVVSVPLANITAGGPTTFCQGGSVTLTASSGFSYLWTPGNQTSQSIAVSASGNYTVRVTNATGCSATSTPQAVIVNVPAVPIITPSGSTVINTGQTITLTSSAGASYLWTPGGETTPSITLGTAGNYRVTVTYTNGCSAISAVTTITVNNPVPVAITTTGSNSICQGDSVLLTATAGFTYLWLPGLQTTQSIFATAGGVYTVQASNGTSAQVSVIVNDKPMTPSISISYIPNSAYQLTAYEPSAVSYLWSNGMTAQTINVSSAQTVTVRATNAFGCTSNLQTMTVANPTGQPCAKANMLTSYNIIDVTATVAWNPAVTADSFMVAYTPQGGTQLSKVVPGNVSSTQISGLTAGTSYTWLVRTFCSSGTQTSNNALFTTLNGPLSCGSTPVNLSTTKITTITAKLNWFPTTAQNYKVRYRKAGTTAYSYKFVNAISTPNFTYINNLLPVTTYEWSVISICNGSASLYSPVAMFTTADVCPGPGSIEVQEITYDHAVIVWDANAVADTFKILYGIVGSGNTKIKTVIGIPNPGNTFLHNLTANTNYHAQVKTKCIDGGLSLWSDTVFFQTLPTPQPRIGGSNNALQLNGYPNPAHDKMSYAFVAGKESEYSIKVTDMAGRELMKQFRYANEGINGDELNLTGFTSGIYILVVEQGPVSGRFKFSVD